MKSTYLIIADYHKPEEHFAYEEGICEMMETLESDIETIFNHDHDFFPCHELIHIGPFDEDGDLMLAYQLCFILFLQYDVSDPEVSFPKDKTELDLVNAVCYKLQHGDSNEDGFFDNGRGYFDGYKVYHIGIGSMNLKLLSEGFF